jgi:Tol biopolymer transport system component
MGLPSGTKLGPYEIQSPLGAGGMGEVYRARDTRLDRTVAVKILPTHLSESVEARQRFDREAHPISSVSHPNICHLYDIGQQDGTSYLVMEYLEGETLADRLRKGALPLEQVLKVGAEICEGLEKAHRSGVVHRDLKPSNIMLTKSGAKLMDFGLARATAAAVSAGSSSNSLPTMSGPLTEEGTIVGTFQYMSPEQVEGKEADARSDIFSLGAVLYEMVTGKRAFEGKTTASTIAAILAAEPKPISAIQPMSPLGLEHVVKTCLAKDPEERLQTAHDVKVELRWVADSSSQMGTSVRPPAAKRIIPALLVACVLAMAALVAAVLFLPRPAAPTHEVRATIPAPEKADFQLMDDDAAGPVVISRDGKTIAFTARDDQGRSRLWVRALNGDEAHPLSGSEGATYPFWSPDGRWLGFFANGKLKKAPIETGPVLEIADAPRARGGSWGTNNLILFAPEPNQPIFVVPASGGAVRPVTTINHELHTTHRWPVWLVDGNHFLYLASSHGNPTASDHNGIYLASLDGQKERMLMPADGNVVVASGYLLCVQNNILMAVPFNEKKGELNGDPAPVSQDVTHNPGTWRSAFDASLSEVLVYQAGNSAKPSQLLWMAPGDKAATIAADYDNYRDLRLSRDGLRLAVTIGSPRSELWIYDLARRVKTRLTFTEAGFISRVVWAPDGTRIAFSEVGSSGAKMYVKEAGGSGRQEELFSPGTVFNLVDDWSKDGNYILYHADVPPGPSSLYVLPMTAERKPRPFLSSRFLTPFAAHFSPDGKWVAYLSTETGTIEAYVTAFPDAIGKWQISTDGARKVDWFPSGRALLYEKMDGTLVKVPFAMHGKNPEIGAAQPYLKARPRITTYGGAWDLATDGRVIVITDSGDTIHTINLVLNWTAALKK